MRILVSGSRGLVGGVLTQRLLARGDTVLHLSRALKHEPDWVTWDPSTGFIEKDEIGEIDAVVHLAGESIFGLKWTDEKKKKILESRSNGTRLLAEAVGGLEKPPEVFVSASAIGFYGDRGEVILTEESDPGTNFLAQVCVEWEAAVEPARAAGIRDVILRFGVILSADGGALKTMLPAFKMGLGGRLGTGRQFMSWIVLDDVVRLLLRALDVREMRGVYNATSPRPVRNEEFTSLLGEALHRPTALPIPEVLLHVGLGEMADELLLASARVIPRRLTEEGYSLEHPELASALKAVLG